MNRNFIAPSELLGKFVYVYRNLTKNCWSIRQSGLVRCHAKSVQLKNVRFVVQKGGYNRFLKDKRKNVHAFIVGELVAIDSPGLKIATSEATYNPVIAPLFHTVEKCFKGREYYFSPQDSLTYGYCCGKTVFVSNVKC